MIALMMEAVRSLFTTTLHGAVCQKALIFKAI
jgi:hypothetical protein